MDPLTLAAARLSADLVRETNEAPPGLPPPSGVVRLVVDGASPEEALKALRLFEARPENRYPMIIFSDRFDDLASFLDLAFAQVEADERIVREGLAEDERVVAACPGPSARSIEALVDWLARVARALTAELAGLIVVLAPARVTDPAGYEAFCDRLSRAASWPELVIVARRDDEPTPDSPSKDRHGVARLVVDRRALLEHVKQLQSPHRIGPAREDVPRLTPAQRRELERKTGKRIPSEDAGRALRALLLEAGEAHSAGDFERAAKRFRMARTWCHMLGQVADAIVCTISIGTALFSCGRTKQALDAYASARTQALQSGLDRLAIQADLGIATTQYATEQYEAAFAAYERIIESATKAEMPPLVLESTRMSAECLAARGRAAEASVRLRSVLAALEAPEAAPMPGLRRLVEERLSQLAQLDAAWLHG